MTPTVSWLLPVKNGMPYLPETLASIEAQTYRDFEVLAWDNGSTDDTVEELKRWIPTRLPGRIVTGQPRELGGSLAGLTEMSQAEFCARIDADDIALPDRLQLQLDYLRGHPEISLVGGQVQFIDAKGNRLDKHVTHPVAPEDILFRMIMHNPFWHPTVVFRRQIVLEVGNYRDIGFVEDYELWLRLLCCHQLANLPDIVLNYRIHEQAVTAKALRENLFRPKMDRYFIEHAPILFGWSESVARNFRTKKIRFMLPAALQLGRHLAGTSRPFWEPLRQPHVIDALLSQIKIYDLPSRLFLMALDRRPLDPINRFRRVLARLKQS